MNIETFIYDDTKFIRVENYSGFDLFISKRPKYPKRKYIDIGVIKPGTFLISQIDIPLDEYCFYFKEKQCTSQ